MFQLNNSVVFDSVDEDLGDTSLPPSSMVSNGPLTSSDSSVSTLVLKQGKAKWFDFNATGSLGPACAGKITVSGAP